MIQIIGLGYELVTCKYKSSLR